jgi:hypothetical protein
MDLRGYYRKLKEIEKGLAEEFVVVRSLATPDGGVDGTLTEVARALAAKMIADGMAELADKAESDALRAKWAEEKKQEDQKRAAAKIQLTVLTETDLRALQRGSKASGKE